MTDETEDEPNVIDLAAARDQLKRDLETGRMPQASMGADERIQYLEEMNKKHAYIVSYGGKPAITMYVYSNVYDKEVLEFHTTDSISTTYSNQSVTEGRNKIELGKWWIKHLERRQYKSVFFDPGKDKEDNGCLNLWEGMSVVPAKGNWKPVMAHLYRILCNSDREKFQYTIRWIAWAIQNPGQRAEVALIFKGKEGAGKGFIFTQLARAFGEHGLCISSREHLTGKFNAHLGRTVFLFADEAYYPGDKDVEGVLKQLITEERMPTEAKFRDVGLSKNFLHIAMSTNQDWVIPAQDDSRRYFINEVDNRYAKNQTTDAIRVAYFNMLWSCMDNGGREAMVYDLLKMDLTNWRPRDSMPSTSEMEHQKALSLPKMEGLVFAILEDGVFPGKTNTFGKHESSAEEIIHHLNKLNGRDTDLSPIKLVAFLKKLGVEKRRTSKCTMWEFPALPEVRANWDKLKGAYRWENIKDEWRTEKLNY